MSADPPRHDGQLAAAISNTVVKALARTTGRGPTKAKTTLGDNGVFVVLQDSLTVGEQTLVHAGEGEVVLDLRRRWQRVMEVEVSREIEELTGRKVIGFMSDNHIDPDLAVEVFVLEPLAGPAAARPPSEERHRPPIPHRNDEGDHAGPPSGLVEARPHPSAIQDAARQVGDTGLEPVTSALSRRRSPS
jgi:uncharacterized protein YbcI